MVHTTVRIICGLGEPPETDSSPPGKNAGIFAPIFNQAETYTPSLMTTATGIFETSPLAPQVMFWPVRPL